MARGGVLAKGFEGGTEARDGENLRFLCTSQYIAPLMAGRRMARTSRSTVVVGAEVCRGREVGLCFWQTPVLALVPDDVSFSLRSPRNIAAAVAAAAAIGGVAWYFLRRPRLTEEEIEHARRDHLASVGRITDGSITETPFVQEETHTPRLIVYNYRIGGVCYEAAQDVTALTEKVRDVRTDLPVQVRYEPHNPANSIVVAESWSGLRLSADVPRPVPGIDRHVDDSRGPATHGD